MATIAELLADGAIEEVAADENAAEQELRMARDHLAAVPSIVQQDPILAYTGLYDGVRKAISAHMRMNGYRATKGLGHHMKIIAYAEAVLADKNVENELAQLDRLRSQRNDTEYSVRFLSPVQVEDDLPIATAIVEAIADDLGL